MSNELAIAKLYSFNKALTGYASDEERLNIANASLKELQDMILVYENDSANLERMKTTEEYYEWKRNRDKTRKPHLQELDDFHRYCCEHSTTLNAVLNCYNQTYQKLAELEHEPTKAPKLALTYAMRK